MIELLISFLLGCLVVAILIWAVRFLGMPEIVQKGVIVFSVLLMLIWFVRYALPALGVRY